MPEPRRLLLVGWDAADWQVIHPLIDAGRMPNLRRLVEGGVCGNLATLSPCLTPMLWTSVATGMLAERHGVLGFAKVSADGLRVEPTGSGDLREPPFWRLLEQAGFRTGLVGWPVSHPAEALSVWSVSDRAADGLAWGAEGLKPVVEGSVSPSELTGFCSDLRVHPCEVGAAELEAFIPGVSALDPTQHPRLATLAEIVARQATVQSWATALLETEADGWDFVGVYFDGLDRVGHEFMPFRPPCRPGIDPEEVQRYGGVVDAMYGFLDLMLGRLVELAGEGTTVMVVSDHGFRSGADRPAGVPAAGRIEAAGAEWHREYGVLVMSGPGIRHDGRVHGATLLDVAPTVLHLFGQPVARDLPGRVLLDALEIREEVRWIPSRAGVNGEAVSRVTPVALEEAELRRLVAIGYLPAGVLEGAASVRLVRNESLVNLALALLSTGKPAEAVGCLDRVCAEEPGNLRYGLVRTHGLLRSGRHGEALEWIEGAFRQGADDVKLKLELMLCGALAGLGRAQEAEERIRRLTGEHPGCAAVWQVLGQLLASRGAFEEAAESLRRALALRPGLVSVHEELARLELGRRRPEAAAAAALEGIRMIFWNPQAHLLRGRALEEMGDLAGAIRSLSTATAQSPRLGEAHYRLSQLYHRVGDMARALEHHQKAFGLVDPRGSQAGESRPSSPDLPLQGDPGPAGRVVVVSGIPRSGTSLLMEMLEAGGMRIFCDALRPADEDNPRGYREWSRLADCEDMGSAMTEALGGAVKVVIPRVFGLPPGFAYDVLVMERDLGEVGDSQEAMLKRRGLPVTSQDRESAQRAYRRWMDELPRLLGSMRDVRWMRVRHEQLISDPAAAAADICSWLGRDLDIQAMVSMVDPRLHRHCSSQFGKEDER